MSVAALLPTQQLYVHQDLDQLCVNAIRALAMDAVEKANSGHPGMVMGMADAAYVLWMNFLKHNPNDPDWPDRDRFVLSAGHGSMLLYSLLHFTGYAVSLDDIKNFRQLHSRTPGHPERGMTPGVETTTGPLGQGISNAVGMALAERLLATRFNQPGFPIIDHYTYVIAGDGDLMVGPSHEASSLAGHFKLGKLIVLYDSNRISIDGPTDLAFTENVAQRFTAYGWHVTETNGHDCDEVTVAIAGAQAETGRPSLIICHTHIAYGSPNKQDSEKSHGAPLGAEEVRLSKQALGWPEEPTFYVPDEVYEHTLPVAQAGAQHQRAWEDMMIRYREVYPELAQLWDQMHARQLPEDWAAVLPAFEPNSKGVATRAASGQTLNALAPLIPGLIGGSADLTGSNNTQIKGTSVIQSDRFEGRNIHFGVREHAMGAIMNGMALHGGLIPFGGTFLVFSDYMRPAIRMAALMQVQVIYVFTHDSIAVGEDGPTHQPIEHVPSLRLIPNLYIVRPADASETAYAWQTALEHRDGPTALVLTRQGIPVLPRNGDSYGMYGSLAPASGALRGGYVLYSAPQPGVILIATGSEVQIALAAALLLERDMIAVRVVSMPCWEVFAQQDEAYRDSVLPSDVWARVAVEATMSFGWERYVGARGRAIGVDRFGASAPFKDLLTYFNLTAERVAEVAREVLHS